MTDLPARAPVLAPLSPSQMATIAVLAEGYSEREAARLLGVELCTVRMQVQLAARKVPGDLPARVRLIAWWRGAPAAVLGPPGVPAGRQEVMMTALSLREGRGCPACGYVRGVQQGASPHPEGEP